MTSPTVSIVIPTRNRHGLLQEAVESVLSQSFTDWELIVVDDASDDGTWPWLQSLNDRRIRPLRMAEPSEQSKTRNTGARAARGEFTLSFDDDDILRPQAVERHVHALRAHPQTVASIAGFEAFDEQGSSKSRRIVRRETVRGIWEDVLFGWIAVAGQCTIRTEALRSIGGWNEAFIRATDHEMWSRLARLGPVVLLPDTLLRYRVHGGQWRPQNLVEIMTRAREIAVGQTNGHERIVGARVLRARELANTALDRFLEARALQALRLYLQALRTMPRLLQSPLTRPMVLVPMSRCLLGSFGIRAGRALLTRVRRAQQADLDFSVRTVVETDEHWRRQSQAQQSRSPRAGG